MDDLPSQIAAAARQAAQDGFTPHHVSLCPADWPLGFPRIELVPAPKAARSCLWAYDAKGHRLVPYVLLAPDHSA